MCHISVYVTKIGLTYNSAISLTQHQHIYKHTKKAHFSSLQINHFIRKSQNYK